MTGFLPIARRWWWLLLASTVVAGVAGFAVVKAQAPRYEASAKLLVGPINTDLDTLRAAGQLAQTYAQLATSQQLLEQTAAGLELSLANTEVSASANDVTRLITIRARDRSPERAAAVANALSDSLVTLAASTGRPEGELQLIDRAAVPVDPLSPNAALLAILAALAGLLGSFTLVLLVEYLRNSVARAEELAALSGADVLASLAGGRRKPGSFVVEVSPDSHDAASYRLLASEVELHERAPGMVVIGVEGGEGAGEVSANLALVLAESRPVVVVDANPHEGELSALFSASEHRGLAELARRVELLAKQEDMLRHFRLQVRPNLELVPCGGLGGRELLEPDRIADLVLRLSAEGAFVLACPPPLGRSRSALAWSRALETALLVAGKDHAGRDRVRETADSLRRSGAELIGATLTTGWRRPLTATRRRSSRLSRRVAPASGRPAESAALESPFAHEPPDGDAQSNTVRGASPTGS